MQISQGMKGMSGLPMDILDEVISKSKQKIRITCQ